MSQTDINAGVTHDVVIHFNNSQRLGLVIRPQSYRVGTTPKFAPQLASGNRTSVDLSWLRSFLFTFERGVQDHWVSDPSRSRQLAFGQNLIVDPDGTLLPAIVPYPTASLPNSPVEVTEGLVQYFIMSTSPRLLTSAGLWTYTQLNYAGRIHGWVMSHTNQNGMDLTVQPLAAIMHSNVAFIATPNSGLLAYGNTGANPAARPYVPVFANSVFTNFSAGYYFRLTQLTGMYNYDKKLWKTLVNQIAYYDSGTRKWTSWQDVGEATSSIVSTENFVGRTFFGKPDGLWAFDAGRIYQIEDYTAESDVDNFRLLRAYRGALYYNIGKRLLRYTAGGSIEEIPWPSGVIKGGLPGMGVLILWAEDNRFGGDTLWGFNAETGALFPFYSLSAYVKTESPATLAFIVGAPKTVMLGPVHTSQYSTTGQSVMTFQSDTPMWKPDQQNEVASHPAQVGLVTVDLGTPALLKQLVRIKAYYQMKAGDYIQIYREGISQHYTADSVVVSWFGTPTNNYTAPFLYDGSSNIIVGALSQFDTLHILIRLGGMGEPLSTLQYETAPGVWADLPSVRHYNVAAGRSTDPYDWVASWVVPTDWVATDTYAANAYHMRIVWNVPFAGSFGIYANSVRRSEYTLVTRTLLGTFTDATVEAAALELLTPIAMYTISLSVFVHSATNVNCKLFGIELEYTIPETTKLQIAMIGVATQGVKRLDGVVENSAAWTAQTLFSLWTSGVPVPVQLPFPYPTGHTRSMVVEINPPGISVPVLAYENSFLGSDYALVLKEV